MQRTIRLRLHPDMETAKILTQTIEQYTLSFNTVCKLGWELGITNGVGLHKETYYTQRALTGLPSQLVCAARVKATEALQSAKMLKRRGKTVNCPASKRCSIRYDARSYTLWLNRSELTILSLNGRIKLSFEIAEYYQQYLNWKHTSADLMQDRKGRWWLHVMMEKSMPECQLSDETVGVDLGIVSPATDNRGTFYGAKHWKQVEDKTFELRRRLQRKGTKSAKRHLKRLAGRQKRFRKDCDHVLSKHLVQSVRSGATLVFEDLTNIRGRAKARKEQRRRLHSWSFAQLQAFVSYKAEAKGIRVDFVDPRYTSQKCSQCGHISRKNRPNQVEFRCKACKFEDLADHNAAVNIRADYLKHRAAVNPPIVSDSGLGTSSALFRAG